MPPKCPRISTPFSLRFEKRSATNKYTLALDFEETRSIELIFELHERFESRIIVWK